VNHALELFNAVADPSRLRILALLRVMELSVGELAQSLGQSQPRVSRHVKILDSAGLLARRREGAWTFLAPTQAAKPVYAILDAEPADPVLADDRARLEAIRAIRVEEADSYFDRQAPHWDALRSLQVPEAQVEAAIVERLSGAPIGRLLDIGTGTGRMLELLGPLAASATGFDRSPAMLRLARAKLPALDLRQGDMYALPIPPAAFDTVVMHQVLHYAQHPGAAIAEAARGLAEEGRLLVVDFATHRSEALRERHAHQWLGFSDAQIGAWFTEAGLESSPPLALEGALTVKLWLGRKERSFL
jgi:ubiquinone/menaquinone biosynthesis C-methylase UbiE